jgi:heme o synthase
MSIRELKANLQAISSPVPVDRNWAAVYAELFKARLTLLVLITTLVGFYLGSQGGINHLLLAHAVFGMALVASGGAALNQLFERDYDARMRRTQNRPLPSGRLQPGTVLLVGSVLGFGGLLYLGLTVNLLTALIGAFTLVMYVLVYTPLKRLTWLNTLVGAIPGAIPPLMGWTAARGALSSEAFALFAIQAFWQIPHFMAIAWMYRDEYARAGFKMLPLFDPRGERTSQQALSHTAALVVVSICPYLFHLTGPIYLVGALLLGAGFLWYALVFARQLTLESARKLFYFSILYLPLLLGLVVLDKVK